MKRFTTILALLLIAKVCEADEGKSDYRFFAGARHPSELLTADSLSASRLALHGLDAGMTHTIHSWVDPRSAVAIAGRSLVLLGIDLPLLSVAVIFPHELFGHAARHREFDGRPEVHFDLPLPYSLKANHFVVNSPTRLLYLGERIVANLAGLQAQEASQRMLTWTVFQTHVMRRGDAMIYAATSLTHAAQTFAGADLRTVGSQVGPAYRGNAVSYRDSIRGALVLDALDPMFLASLYYGVRYLVRGEQVQKAPSLDVFGGRFFLSSRSLPVPWGVEHQLHVLGAWADPLFQFDLGVRTGLGARESVGLELQVMGPRLLQNVMRVGLEVAGWSQPLVTSVAALGPPKSFTLVGGILEDGDLRDRTTTGGAARVLFEVDRPGWFFGTRLGYKSLGLWGERELSDGFEVALTGGVRIE